MKTPTFYIGHCFVVQAVHFIDLWPKSFSGFLFFLILAMSILLIIILSVLLSTFFIYSVAKRQFSFVFFEFFVLLATIAVVFFMAHMGKVRAAHIAHDTMGVEYTTQKYDFKTVFEESGWQSSNIEPTENGEKLSKYLRGSHSDENIWKTISSIKSISYSLNEKKEVNYVFVQFKLLSGEKVILKMPAIDALSLLFHIESQPSRSIKKQPDASSYSSDPEFDKATREKEFENSIRIE